MSLLSDETVDTKNPTVSNDRTVTINADYVDPIGEHNKIEAGYQSIIKQTDDDYNS